MGKKKKNLMKETATEVIGYGKPVPKEKRIPMDVSKSIVDKVEELWNERKVKHIFDGVTGFEPKEELED